MGEALVVWDVGLTCHCCQARADGGHGARHAAGVGAAVEQLKVLQRIRKAPSGRRAISGADPNASRGKGRPPVPIPHSPLSLGSRTAGFGHGHAVQRFLQEVLTEELRHLSQRVHCGTERPSAPTPPSATKWGAGALGGTWVTSGAVDGLPRDALDGPIPVHEEAVTQWVAEPLHGGGHSPTVGQGHAAGTAEEGALRGEQGLAGPVGSGGHAALGYRDGAGNIDPMEAEGGRTLGCSGVDTAPRRV